MCLYVLDGPWAVEPDDLLFEWRHLMREEITAHQRPSEFIRGLGLPIWMTFASSGATFSRSYDS